MHDSGGRTWTPLGASYTADHTHHAAEAQTQQKRGQQAERAELRGAEKGALGPAVPEVSTGWYHEPINSLFA